MHSSDGAADERQRIPRLAPGWAPEDVALTPLEGFLLSRMDGRTPWIMLRQIGGVAPEQVDDFLQRWLEAGAVEFVEPKRDSPRVAEAPEPETRLDSSLDISVDFQRRILDYDDPSQRSYHELLGVPRGADTADIKRAYFALSKEFHPDRYFRKKIGPFAARLDSVFKRLVEAYELLSDPATRAELERSMDSAPPEPAPGSYRHAERGRSERIAPEAPRPGGYRAPTPMENLARLRQRFRIPKKLLVERQFRARQMYQAAQVSAKHKRWLEAAAGMRLAIAFDPWNREYKQGFGEIQRNVHAVRAIELLERAEAAGDRAEALHLIEEAIGFRPMDPEVNTRAARLALQLGEIDRARECAETLCEVGPDVAMHHALLCTALRRLGRTLEAQQALERAASLDSGAPEVKAERLKLGRRALRR